jgi:hypothetical protein
LCPFKWALAKEIPLKFAGNTAFLQIEEVIQNTQKGVFSCVYLTKGIFTDSQMLECKSGLNDARLL